MHLTFSLFFPCILLPGDHQSFSYSLFSLFVSLPLFLSLFPVLSFSKCMIAVDPCWKVTLPTMPCWEHSGSDNSHAVSKQPSCVRAREEDIGHFRRLWMIICLTTVGYKSSSCRTHTAAQIFPAHLCSTLRERNSHRDHNESEGNAGNEPKSPSLSHAAPCEHPPSTVCACVWQTKRVEVSVVTCISPPGRRIKHQCCDSVSSLQAVQQNVQ